MVTVNDDYLVVVISYLIKLIVLLTVSIIGEMVHTLRKSKEYPHYYRHLKALSCIMQNI